MPGVPKFSVEVAGSFYTYTLYDRGGREVFDLDTAAETAEWLYGEDWQSVFNGNEAIDRDDYVARLSAVR